MKGNTTVTHPHKSIDGVQLIGFESFLVSNSSYELGYYTETVEIHSDYCKIVEGLGLASKGDDSLTCLCNQSVVSGQWWMSDLGLGACP